jgi:uncharacterized LabA/DUF88 family protein
MSRVCVFIDGSNLYFALKRNGKNTRVDYHQLSLALTHPDRTLIRTYYYNAVFDINAFPDKAKNQQSFLDSLDRTPYLDLRLGRIVQNREGHRMEKGVDVRMASDMVYYAARDFYDIAVVLTEDQDFAPALALVKEMGKHIELAIFPDAQNREMVRVSDKLINLAEVVDANSEKIFPPMSEKDEPRFEHLAPPVSTSTVSRPPTPVPVSLPPPAPIQTSTPAPAPVRPSAPPPVDEEDNIGNR